MRQNSTNRKMGSSSLNQVDFENPQNPPKEKEVKFVVSSTYNANAESEMLKTKLISSVKPNKFSKA